jgi:hypothetical protein
MGPKAPDLLADWLDTADLADSDDDGRDVEPDWLGQAAAIVHFLRPYADVREQPDAATAANIAKAYSVMFEVQHRQRRAIKITQAWCRALKAGNGRSFEELLTALRSADHAIPQHLKLPQPFVDKVLKAKTRHVSPFTILGTIASMTGALNVPAGKKVKSAAAYLQKADPAVRSQKNAQQNARRTKKDLKPKRR